MSERSRLPIATLILIAANLIAAFASVWQPDLLFDFGFNPAHPRVQTAFTSLFLHANLIHLLANMVFLAAVGAAVELATGTLRFIVAYLVSGLAGVGLHALLAAKPVWDDPHPLVGASGCIAGCAAYYGIRYLGLKVPIAPRRAVPVAGVLAVWLVLQIVGAFFTIGGGNAATAYWSHLGGFGAGLMLCFIFRTPDMGHLELHHKVLEEMNERGPAAAAAAALRHLEVHPDDPKALQQLIEAHRLMDDAEGEAGALVKIIELLPDGELGTPICRLREIGALSMLPPLRRLKFAEKVSGVSKDAAMCLLESVIEEPATESQRPEAMLALVGLVRDETPAHADEVLVRLQNEYPLHPTVELAKARGWLA